MVEHVYLAKMTVVQQYYKVRIVINAFYSGAAEWWG